MTKTPIALALLRALLFAGRANADEARPALGYVFGQYAIPYHYAVLSQKLDSGQRQTTDQFGRRDTAIGLQSFGFGAGIGYSGLNAQLDVRNAFDITTGALTFGFRGRIPIGRFEAWARAGIGPGLVFNNSTGKVDTTGAIVTSLEAGADYFIVDRRLALGLKALATPQWNFPSDFFADFGLNLGLRLII